jgi:hypothetical protein
VQDSLRKLELFNPILGATSTRSGKDNDQDKQKFFEKVASLSDQAHELNQGLLKLNDD